MFFIPDSMQYVALMLACLLLTVPLEIVLGARVYRRPLRLLQAVLVTVLVFSIWDIIAINAGLWSYSERFTTGLMLPFALPLEELIFFVAIPLCGLLTYEAVGRVLTYFKKVVHRRTRSHQENENA
ncbi:lycopene cyclase domain-containing protein [Leucobacter sp. HY1910]